MPSASRAIVLLVPLVLGCGSRLPHPPFAPQPTSALVEVDSPPPPARVEIVPASPAPGAAWVDGEWMWRRGRWAWLPGRWVLAPAGTSFSPAAFVRGTDGTLWLAPGVWRDAKGEPIDPPRALALASVETGAVVDADGATLDTGPVVRQRPKPSASRSAAP